MSWVFVCGKKCMHNFRFLTNIVYIFLVINSITRFIVVCLSVFVSFYMYVSIYTERKKFSKFFTSLVFVYKSMSQKCFRIEHRPGMTSEQRERAIGMVTAGMLARDVAPRFQPHESTINRLLNRFQQTGNVTDRPRSGRPLKTMLRKTVFSRLHLDAIDFFLVES